MPLDRDASTKSVAAMGKKRDELRRIEFCDLKRSIAAVFRSIAALYASSSKTSRALLAARSCQNSPVLPRSALSSEAINGNGLATPS